jgi:hypothetical protein
MRAAMEFAVMVDIENPDNESVEIARDEAVPVTNTGAPVADASQPVAPPPRKPRKPLAPPTKHKSGKRKPLAPLTIAERLECGCFSLPQSAQLACCSVSSLHKAAREGRLEFVKMGGCTRVRGPELSRYMNTKRGE